MTQLRSVRETERKRRHSPRREPYSLVAKMAAQSDSVALAVLSDSTAVDFTFSQTDYDWVGRLARWLGQKYPAYTVNYGLWNDTTQLYGTFNTFQTGSAVPSVTDAMVHTNGALTTTDTGQTYDSASTLVISGNKMVGPGGGNGTAYLDQTAHDYTWTGSVTFDTVATTSLRLYLEYASTSNCLTVTFSVTGSGMTVTIGQNVNGTPLTLYTSSVQAAVTLGSTQTISVALATVAPSATAGPVKTVSVTVGAFSSGTISMNAAVHDPFKGVTGRWFAMALLNNTTAMSINSFTITKSPLTLNVFNGSVSGAVSAYPTAVTGRLAKMIPWPPDLIVNALGQENDGTGGGNDRQLIYGLSRRLQDTWPNAQLAILLEPPRTPTSSTYTQELGRIESARLLASQEGWSVIDATRRFLANPTYGADWGVGDGTHYLAAGQTAYFNEVVRHFTRDSGPAQLPGASGRVSRLTIPPASFAISEGAPALGLLSSYIPSWSFDPSTQGGIVTVADLPSHWQAFNMWADVTVPILSGITVGTNDSSQWEGSYAFLGSSLVGTDGGTVPAALTVGTVVNRSTPTNAAAQSYPVQLLAGIYITGTPLVVRVRRIAAAVADNFAAAAYVTRVTLERAA